MSRTYRNNRGRLFRGHFNEYAIKPVVNDGKMDYRCHCAYCRGAKIHKILRSVSFIPETEGLEACISENLEISNSRTLRRNKEWR